MVNKSIHKVISQYHKINLQSVIMFILLIIFILKKYNKIKLPSDECFLESKFSMKENSESWSR